MTKDTSTPTESFRPALVKLADDVDEMETELLRGFDSRRDILDWMQRLTIRTFGELPQAWYNEVARQFRGEPESEREKTLVSALLTEHSRRRELSEDAAETLRERLAALTIRPAFHRAFRNLRKDAGEYVDAESSTQSGHDPNVQRYVAMRPALDELEENQQQALTECLDGFDSREQILDWGKTVELATHGEMSESFIARCYRESSTSTLLTRADMVGLRGRELFAARYLLPAMNRGVRDLAGRAKERPDAEIAETEVTTL